MGSVVKNDDEKYQTLLVSLPYLPVSFHDPSRPIAPVILEDRLEMLTVEDLEFYQLVSRAMGYEKNSVGIEEKQIFSLQEQVKEIAPNRKIKKLFVFIHDVRMIVGALRLRKQDMPFIENVDVIASHIQRNWHHPTFKLGERFPWIDDVRLLIEKEDFSAAHRRVSEVVWQRLRFLSDSHFFNFKAVVLYVLKWNIFHVWGTRDEKKGHDRFHKVVKEVIGNYGEIFS